MKAIFDHISFESSKNVTKAYSTSFSSAVKMLSPTIRQDIYNIYGFVRFADEIVDSFHEYDKKKLFDSFEQDFYSALEDGISLNPILNSFQHTVKKYDIPIDLIKAFLASMRWDLTKTECNNKDEYHNYIYGSADVVGLMCLKVFVKGDSAKYEELKHSAMKLGSAFQKVNFLRDMKEDFESLNRTYFPNANLEQLDEASKKQIIDEIENDFKYGYEGILKLPIEAKLGVYTAYVYYKKLLYKLKKTPSAKIRTTRIRVPDYEKLSLFAKCYFSYKLNIL
ncbi:phytoene/squalene synthase family protein [Flavobacterium microcysteis]|uniref:Phytoene/squalene synthase family protein n=1 Tax=Flavobacterium microcysteis TaxID=2596891 RepID=A0A501QMK6_9FLAO|nr:phytoene/squalene synthase family protein [Flavobacterium microcysteis]TPD73377.1 phytoene/squalene synthase family protein [Flavobacterium microcysteis]